MDRVGLDAHLARLGRPGHVELLRQRRTGWTSGPWTLTEEIDGDRGLWRHRDLPDEDAWCRTILVEVLDDARRQPVPGERRTDHVRAPVETAPPRPAGGPPAVRWRRRLAARSRLAGPPGDTAYDGLLLVRDTGSWWDHGADGTLLLTALGLPDGEVRWSVPIAPTSTARWTALPGGVLHHDVDRVSCLDPRDGSTRWSRQWPTRVLVHGLGADVVALADDHPTTTLVGLDLATGATRWTAASGGLDAWSTWRREPPPPRRTGAGTVDGHLVVAELDVADGAWRTVLRAPLGAAPDLAAHPGLRVLVDDRATSGALVVGHRGPGGDVALAVVRLGDPRVEWLPDLGAGRWTALDAHHLLGGSRRADDGVPASLVRPGTGTLWQRDEPLAPVHRADGTTVLQRLRRAANGRHDEPDGVVAVADDGTDLWHAPGGYARACGEEVWVDHGPDVTSYDVRDGSVRWRVPRDLGGPGLLHRADLDHVAADRARGAVSARVAGDVAVAYG